jgi:hypothetical protein
MNELIPLAVDLDDSLAKTIPGTLEHASEILGHPLEFGDISDTEYWARYGVGDTEAISLVQGYGAKGFPGLEPMEGSQEAMVRIKQSGIYDPFVLTAREFRLKDVTEEWIAKYFPGVFSEIVISGNHYINEDFRTKEEILLERGARWIVDDSLRHALRAARSGVSSILFGGHPWHYDVEKHPLMHIARNWREVTEILGV